MSGRKGDGHFFSYNSDFFPPLAVLRCLELLDINSYIFIFYSVAETKNRIANSQFREKVRLVRRKARIPREKSDL